MNERLKILHVLHFGSKNKRNGVIEAVLSLAQAQREAGAEVKVASASRNSSVPDSDYVAFDSQKSFQEIGVEYGIMGGTLKQEVYSFLRRNPEGYVSCRDLAEEWGVNINTVNHWCRIGAFPGAKKRRGSGSDGHQLWIIPAGASRPESNR